MTPATPDGPGKRVILAIAITIVAWASAFVVIRGTGTHFSPGALALGRLVVGSVLLGLVVVVGRRWVAPTGRQWLVIAAFGVLWFGAYNVALNFAEQTLDAGTAAMLMGVGPILIALGAAIFLAEGISRWLAIGAGVAVAGVALIGFGSGGVRFADGAGVWWTLLAALAYSVGVLLQKPLLRQLPAPQVTWLGCTVALVACLPFSGDLLAELQVAPGAAIAGVLYLGAIPTALAFSTWAYALSRMPAAQLGVSTYLVPPLSIGLAFIVFGEAPALLAVIGGGLSLVGVALARRRSAPARMTTDVPDASKSVAE